MEVEFQALMLGFDYAYMVKDFLEEIKCRFMTIEAMIGSKTVLNYISKDGKTTEPRLKIDIAAKYMAM